jgi:hypothetical protein
MAPFQLGRFCVYIKVKVTHKWQISVMTEAKFNDSQVKWKRFIDSTAFIPLQLRALIKRVIYVTASWSWRNSYISHIYIYMCVCVCVCVCSCIAIVIKDYIGFPSRSRNPRIRHACHLAPSIRKSWLADKRRSLGRYSSFADSGHGDYRFHFLCDGTSLV